MSETDTTVIISDSVRRRELADFIAHLVLPEESQVERFMLLSVHVDYDEPVFHKLWTKKKLSDEIEDAICAYRKGRRAEEDGI